METKIYLMICQVAQTNAYRFVMMLGAFRMLPRIIVVIISHKLKRRGMLLLLVEYVISIKTSQMIPLPKKISWLLKILLSQTKTELVQK
jgi:hypothetical protein